MQFFFIFSIIYNYFTFIAILSIIPCENRYIYVIQKKTFNDKYYPYAAFY